MDTLSHGSGNSMCAPQPMSGTAAKKLVRLPTLLRGHAWAIYESLGETDNVSYEALKKAIISRLNPDTDEDCLAAREQLTHRRLQEGTESLDELARDIETLLD